MVRSGGRQRGFLVDRLVSLISSSEHPAASPGRAAPRPGRQAFGVDRLLMLGQGADAITCERVDLKSLMPAAH